VRVAVAVRVDLIHCREGAGRVRWDSDLRGGASAPHFSFSVLAGAAPVSEMTSGAIDVVEYHSRYPVLFYAHAPTRQEYRGFAEPRLGHRPG
jgi:hypothetical protein